MNVNDALKSTTGVTTEPSPAPARTGNQAANAQNGAAATSAASDSVRLSATYQTLENKVNNNSGSFDAKKVAEIKAAIANGTFQIDADKIASGLLDTVQTLISARKA